jgi:hypothetical protein
MVLSRGRFVQGVGMKIEILDGMRVLRLNDRGLHSALDNDRLTMICGMQASGHAIFCNPRPSVIWGTVLVGRAAGIASPRAGLSRPCDRIGFIALSSGNRGRHDYTL